MALRPLHNGVLVKRLEAEEKTAGGIIIPDTAKEKPQEAEVIAVGPGKLTDGGERLPVDVKVGDRVYIKKWGGDEVKIGGEEMLLITDDQIVGVLD